MKSVIVIGGGIAGLSAARALRAAGCQVTIIEAAERPGGVIRSSRRDGFLREHAANGFLGAEGGAVDLAQDLGVPIDEASDAAKKRWIWVDGGLKALPAGPVDLVRTDLLSWRGKLAALGEPLRPVGLGVDESVADFARRRLGDEVARKIIAPFVTGIFAGDSEQLSLPAAFPRLAELDLRGGLVRGSLAGMIEKLGEWRPRRGKGEEAEEAAPPAATTPRKKRPRQRLSAPAGGVEALIRALADDLGPALRCGVAAAAVELEGGRPKVRLGDGSAMTADQLVLALPAWAAAGLVAAAAPELGTLLGGFYYAPVAVVHLGYDRTDVPHPLDGFGFLVAPGEQLRMLGCVFDSVLWPGRAPEGKALLRCVLGGMRDPQAVDLSDEDLVIAARRDLKRVLGIEHKPVHVNLVRHPRAIAQYTLGHLERVARCEELARPLGAVLAGSGYHGVAVNSLIADAVRVAGEVTARLGGLVAAALLAVTLAGCGGGKNAASGDSDGGGGTGPAAASDAATGTPAGAAAPYRLGEVDAGGRLRDAGRVEVTVVWPEAPPEALLPAVARPAGGGPAPGGRINACGAPRRPAAQVATLHGVAAAVVTIHDVAAGVAPHAAAPVEIGLRHCRPEPRVQVAPRLDVPLAVINDDERRHGVVLEWVAADGTEALAGFELPLVGQRVELPLDRPGRLRARTAADPDDAGWVVVPAHPYVALTDDHGVAAFDQVPAGSYRISAWVPGAGREVDGRVAVIAGKPAALTLSL